MPNQYRDVGVLKYARKSFLGNLSLVISN